MLHEFFFHLGGTRRFAPGAFHNQPNTTPPTPRHATHVPPDHQRGKGVCGRHDAYPDDKYDGGYLEGPAPSVGVADPVRKEGSEDAPEVEAPDKEFPLDVRQAHVVLDETPRIGADTDVVSEVARVQGGAQGKDLRRSRKADAASGLVPRVALVGFGRADAAAQRRRGLGHAGCVPFRFVWLLRTVCDPLGDGWFGLVWFGLVWFGLVWFRALPSFVAGFSFLT